MKRRTISMLLAACTILANFTGCAEDSGEVDYNLDEQTETRYENKSTIAQFAELEKWEETLAVKDADGKDFTIQIDADIEVPTADHMSVLEVEVLQDEDINYDFASKMAYPVTRYLGFPNVWVDTESDPRIFLNINYLPDDVTSRIEGYTEASYEAESDIFFLSEELLAASREKNVCGLTEEEAEMLAQEFLEESGFQMYQKSEISDLLWTCTSDNEERYINDGYKITFELADDVGIFMGPQELEYNEWGNLFPEKMHSLAVRLEVYVVDEGVIDLRIYNPAEVTNVTKVSSFLPFDSIKSILRNSFEENFEDTYVESEKFSNTQQGLYINSIELIYFRIKTPEKEGSYSYIPAWLFCRRMKVGGEEEKIVYSPVIINAIDGTVIHTEEDC